MKYIVQHPVHGDDYQKLSNLADRKDSAESTFKRAQREGDSEGNEFQELSHDEDGIKPGVHSDTKPSRPEQGDTYQTLSSEDADEEKAGKIYKDNPRPAQGDTYQHLASYKSFK